MKVKVLKTVGQFELIRSNGSFMIRVHNHRPETPCAVELMTVSGVDAEHSATVAFNILTDAWQETLRRN